VSSARPATIRSNWASRRSAGFPTRPIPSNGLISMGFHWSSSSRSTALRRTHLTDRTKGCCYSSTITVTRAIRSRNGASLGSSMCRSGQPCRPSPHRLSAGPAAGDYWATRSYRRSIRRTAGMRPSAGPRQANTAGAGPPRGRPPCTWLNPCRWQRGRSMGGDRGPSAARAPR